MVVFLFIFLFISSVPLLEKFLFFELTAVHYKLLMYQQERLYGFPCKEQKVHFLRTNSKGVVALKFTRSKHTRRDRVSINALYLEKRMISKSRARGLVAELPTNVPVSLSQSLSQPLSYTLSCVYVTERVKRVGFAFLFFFS